MKDERASWEHRLTTAEGKANDFEQKFLRIRDTNRQQPSQRDYETLMDRNMKNLQKIGELEQQSKCVESYRMTLSSREADLEKTKRENDELLNNVLTLKETNRVLKKKLKEAESSLSVASSPVFNNNR